MKRYLTLLTVLLLIVSVTACTAKPAEPVTEAQTEKAAEEKVYESSDGWKVTYDASEIKCEEKDGTASFIYNGDSAGRNEIDFIYVPDKMPDAALYERTASFDQEKVIRSEGFFTGGNWSFTRSLHAEDSADGLGRDIIGVEHNGGTLIIDCIYTKDADENRAIYVSDKLAEVTDTFEFTRHDPQTQYSYVPGTYAREVEQEIEGNVIHVKEKIILNDDHTGTISFQDDVPITWTSYRIISDSEEFEYSVEDTMLYLCVGEYWLQFDKEQ